MLDTLARAPGQQRPAALPMQTRLAPVGTIDVKTRTVDVVFSTGAAVRRERWVGWDTKVPFDEVLLVSAEAVNLDRLKRGAPALDSHSMWSTASQVGVVENPRVANGEGRAAIRFPSAGVDQAADRMFAMVSEGIIRNVSVGYTIDEVDVKAPAKPGEVEIRTITRWTPHEISFVTIGADAGAQVRQQSSVFPVAYHADNALKRSKGEVMSTLAVDTPAPAENRAHQFSADETSKLLQRGAAFGLTAADVSQVLAGDVRSLEAATDAMQNLAATRNAPRQQPHTSLNGAQTFDNPEFMARAVEDAMLAKLAMRAPPEHARSFMPRTMVGLMRDVLSVHGVRERSLSDIDVIRRSMGTAGSHTTSDFPTILGNTMERRLGELFKGAESGASAIAAPGTARDFRTITEGRLTSFPSLEKVPEGAEIKFGTLNEEGEKLVIASFARGISVTFQVLVNDDLNAIDRSLSDVGFAAAMLKAKLIVAALSATLSDNQALFHASHGNLAGSGAAPSELTLSAGRTAMRLQKPPKSTEPLGLSPKIFLVPAELETSAEKLVAAINPASSSDVNVFSGKLQVAVEPRLPNATQWFLFTDPTVYPVIRFLTLEGFEAPKLETDDEFHRLATGYRVHWHCGAGPVDFRGAWKNAGA